MKSFAIATAVALTAASLLAAPADPPKKLDGDQTAQTAAVPQTTEAPKTIQPKRLDGDQPSSTDTQKTQAQQPAASNDSPLVAAAKAQAAKKKSGKKAITNKTLAKGPDNHITTTSGGMPLPEPSLGNGRGKTPKQMAAEAAAQKKAIEDAQKEKEEKEKKLRQERAAAAYNGEGDPYADPGAVEGQMHDANPQTTTTQKPPR